MLRKMILLQVRIVLIILDVVLRSATMIGIWCVMMVVRLLGRCVPEWRMMRPMLNGVLWGVSVLVTEMSYLLNLVAACRPRVGNAFRMLVW